MSTVFDVPCPGCGTQMLVREDGDVECVPCEQRYHARMGHLFPPRQQTDLLSSEQRAPAHHRS